MILGSHTGTLYIGVTSNLYLRIMQHEGGRKAPNSMDKISTLGVPSAMLGTGSSTPRHQALCHTINP